MKRAAGIFIIRKDDRLLICHPTGNDNFWTVPKGTVEEGESNAAAAVRETKEEAGLDIPIDNLVELDPSKYKSGKKTIYPFTFRESNRNDLSLDTAEMSCMSKIDKGVDTGKFEIDDYKWVTFDEAQSLLHEAQSRCLQAISIMYGIEMTNPLKVWRVIIPTRMGDKFVRTKHHKVWDRYVRNITGGASISAPGKGQWVDDEGELIEERIIPVDIACTDGQLKRIIDFTHKHYRQDALMYFQISDNVFIEKSPYK
jgi:8-oxo-dGTP pyrophosphatase MutT (NUDIX family)